MYGTLVTRWAAAGFATLIASLAAPPAWAQHVDAGPRVSLGHLKELEAFVIAKEAYIYGYPLVTMEMTRRVMSNVAKPEGLHAPMGRFVNAREYPTAAFRNVTAPNADTLYSSAWIDVGNEPWVLSLPEENGRYYLFPMLSAWTNIIADPGKRTTGTGPQTYAITGPHWKGTLPHGIKEIRSPTSLVWLLGRTYSTGTPEDYKAVWAIQDDYKLVPLSSYGKDYTPPEGRVDPSVDMKTAVREQVNAMHAGEYFKLLAELMKYNPPAAEDAPILDRMARIGLAPGRTFDMSRLDAAMAKGIDRAPRAGLEEIEAHARHTGRIENGWLVTTKTGRYGTDYLQRATIAMFGLGANLPQDAVYPYTMVDSTGKKLTGADKYVMHFDKGELPPVDGFWSLTMYDGDWFFAANPLNRYTLSQRNALKTNADGSVDLYIQNESPGPDKESNWLPAPKGDMILMLRLYWPKETPPSILNATWRPPKVERAPTRVTGATAPGTARTAAATSSAPIAGSSEVAAAVAVTQVQKLYRGWSVKDQVLGQTVYNDRGDDVGKVADLVVAPDEKLTYAIIGTGGFLGLGARYVAFPVDRFRMTDGKVVLPGATRASIEAEPEFHWPGRQ